VCLDLLARGSLLSGRHNRAAKPCCKARNCLAAKFAECDRQLQGDLVPAVNLYVLPCVSVAQPQLRVTGDVAMTGMRESSSQLLSAATLPL
jgi:hypothetical protein